MKCLHVHNLDDPSTIREVEASIRSNGTAMLNGDKDNIAYVAYLFPLEAKAELIDVCTIRQRLKAEYDQSIALVYQLRNRHTGWVK